MSNDIDVLKITKKEIINSEYMIFQADDDIDLTVGTNLIPRGRVLHLAQYRDELYFTFIPEGGVKEQIYKAVFIPPHTAKIICLRDVLEEEVVGYGAWCSRMSDGMTLIYRACDDPYKDGIVVDLSIEELNGLELRAVHRGKAFFYLTSSYMDAPSVRKLSNNIVLIKYFSKQWNMLCRESDRFLYLAFQNQYLFTLDSETMTLERTFNIEGVAQVARIIGVNDGEFTVQCFMKRWSGESYDYVLVTAKQSIDQHEFSSSNDFAVRELLGSGAFGIVYKAINKSDGCAYAIKRIAVELSENLLARLDHPGIVRYHNTRMEYPSLGWQVNTDMAMISTVGASSKHYRMNITARNAFIYLQMQLCHNSLADWLENNRDPSTRQVYWMKSWFKQIVEAVAYIHEQDIIHRDLKTSFFSKYSSKTDVFALGLILAELCVVMTSEDRGKIFDEYRKGEQSDRISDAETAQLIGMLTQKDPNSRPSCREMLEHEYLLDL